MSSKNKLTERLKQNFDLPVQEHSQWFVRAMTHRSFANEQDIDYDNERLEFLGDAVLDLVICDYLFQEFPEASEGRLSEIKSSVVNTRTLTSVARDIGLDEHLRLSKGEQRATRGQDKVIADSLEAFIGAIYLSCGFEQTLEFVIQYFEQEVERYLSEGTRNYKGMLLEWTQERDYGNPEYRLDEVTGPQHNPCHQVSALINGTPRGTGEGRTKKEAEQEAAREALSDLDSD